ACEALVHLPFDQAMRSLAHEHRVRLRQSLQARREIHSVAENRDPGISAFLNFSDNGGSAIDADPQLRTDAMSNFKIAASIREPLQDRKSRATRPQWCVL